MNGRWKKNPTPAINAYYFSPTGATALTCYGFGGTQTRLYYVTGDATTRIVNELAWNNGWKVTPFPAAKPTNTLTCFGVGGHDARVYYQSATATGQHYGTIYELAQVNGAWVPPTPTPARSNDERAFACYAFGGTATRLYYLAITSQQPLLPSVYELAWTSPSPPLPPRANPPDCQTLINNLSAQLTLARRTNTILPDSELGNDVADLLLECYEGGHITLQQYRAGMEMLQELENLPRHRPGSGP